MTARRDLVRFVRGLTDEQISRGGAGVRLGQLIDAFRAEQAVARPDLADRILDGLNAFQGCGCEAQTRRRLAQHLAAHLTAPDSRTADQTGDPR